MVRMFVLYPFKIGGLALLFWWLFRERLEGKPAILAAVVLAILFHIAIVAALTSWRRSRDARLLRNSLRGELPREGQRTAVAGTIEAVGELLSTPFGGVPCVLYSYEIYRMVSSSSSRGSSHREVDFSGLAMTSTTIRSSNGRFALCGFPYLTGQARATGSEPGRISAAREYIAQTTFERTLAYAGELAALDRAMATTTRSIRLDSQIRDAGQLHLARFEEEYVVDGARVCALGNYSAAEGGLVPGGNAEDRIHLIAGDGPQVLETLAGGARYSRVLATVMLLIVATAIAALFLMPQEWLGQVNG